MSADSGGDWVARSRFDTTSIRWQILVIAFIASAAFAAYLGFNLSQSNYQASLLEDIRENRYPAQIKLQEAFFTLRYIQAKMQDAVITGDLEELETVDALKDQFAALIAEVKAIERNHTISKHNEEINHADSVVEIESAFTRYYLANITLCQIDHQWKCRAVSCCAKRTGKHGAL